MQDVGQPNQQLCVADQPFFFMNGDEKPVLDIDYAQYAIFHAQGAARDLSVRETLDASGAHENSVMPAAANFRLEAVLGAGGRPAPITGVTTAPFTSLLYIGNLTFF